jgi:anti-sigma factor RsiW
MTDQALIMAYLDGTLPEEERIRVEARAQQDSDFRESLEQTRTLFGLMDEPESEAPREPWVNQTRAMFEGQDDERIPTIRPWYSAAAVALVILGLFGGVMFQQNKNQAQQIQVLVDQVSQTQKLLALSMLEQPSAAQRIKAMNTIEREITRPDDEVVSALIQRLRTDPHANVRMRAAEALVTMGSHPDVAPALVDQLKEEVNPQVLITLIETVVMLQAKPAVPALQDITNSDQQPDVVKDRAAYGMGQLL